jgi:hypothetical protein
MSSLLILGLFVLLAAPAFVAFFRRDLGWKTGSFYTALPVALLAWHVGFATGPIPDLKAVARSQGAMLSGDRCAQVLDTAERGRVILDRRNPDRLVVADALWKQLPEEVKSALTECAGSVRPADKQATPVEVVTR